MRVAGLDLSITASGVATCDGETHVLRPPKSLGTANDARIVWARDRITELLFLEAPAFPQLVVIEGFSRNSQQWREEAGGIGYAVRCLLLECNVPYVDVAPLQLKKFATGSGKARDAKDEMIAAAVRAGFGGSNNNAADAWWLREIGLYLTSTIPPRQTKYRDEVAARVRAQMLDTVPA